MARWCALAVAVVAIGCGDKQTNAPIAATPMPAKPAPAAAPTTVKIAGSVIDQTTGRPIGDLEVVLLGDAGEVSTLANGSGEFALAAAPGRYRAFVRSRNWLTMGRAERARLDNLPRKEIVGRPDLAIMPVLDAQTSLEHIELNVVPAIEISGVVYSPDEREVADAIVRVRDVDQLVGPIGSMTRPVLGTDLAITDDHGRYSLFVPAGSYELDVAHPEYGGVGLGTAIDVSGGAAVRHVVQLVRGCIISGRIINADGSPAPDGAIELSQQGINFGPGGRGDAGGFRWATTDDGPVTLRAWPWHSPPSPPRTFECRDGKRYTDVVLRLPDQRPDLSGTIVDANDRPVPLAYLDIRPLDQGDSGQQERADAAGNWHVYNLPPSRFRITAMAPGRGIADTTVIAPRQDLRIALGGTGRIVGTTTELVSGSVEVTFLLCGSKDSPLQIAHEPRVVPVVGGRFTIEQAPACTLSLAVRWRNKLIETTAVVEPDRTAYVEVDIGEPRAKTITGIVRDVAGNAVEGARVTAVLHDREAATARTDASGRYTLQTHSGAQLVAGKGEHVGRNRVGRANVASEQIDLVLDDADY